MQQTFKTPKGTELPMLDLRGKPYLQVAHRLVWFREEKPTWSIETEALTLENGMDRAIFRAVIKDDQARVIATATGHETMKDFPDFIEKAETKAIGRALAMCGYGTQFAPELDEGERLADSPVLPAKPAPAAKVKTAVKKPSAPSTLDQRRQILALCKAKLGVETNDQVIPAIIKEYPSFKGVKSADEISQEMAVYLIKALEAKKPDTGTEVEVTPVEN